MTTATTKQTQAKGWIEMRKHKNIMLSVVSAKVTLGCIVWCNGRFWFLCSLLWLWLGGSIWIFCYVCGFHCAVDCRRAGERYMVLRRPYCRQKGSTSTSTQWHLISGRAFSLYERWFCIGCVPYRVV